ncbi:hypothetical protein C8J56DRAFT_409225 [Mycena floridula]|nr:hypothetical protein C8J56DRAFT_409225 [Mycena floridula]
MRLRLRSVNACVSQRDSTGLAKLLNEQMSDSLELYDLLKVAAQRFILLATQSPADIDSLVHFYAQAASQIDESLSDKGNVDQFHPVRGEHRIPTRQASGSNLLIEHFGVELYPKVWRYVSRTDIAMPEYDKDLGQEYYRAAIIYSIMLARAFALQESFRERLWTIMEDVLVKGVFSGREQEPGCFIAVTVVIHGAGSSMTTIQGKGKDASPWSQFRANPDTTWGWFEVIAALLDVEALIEPALEIPLPSKLILSFRNLKDYLGDGGLQLQDLSSEELWTMFRWVERLPRRHTEPPRTGSKKSDKISMMPADEDDMY